MYPYTKKLTLDEALQLPKNTVVYAGFENPQDLNNFYITTHYNLDGTLFCTALDYATHILKQVVPPEGWGYAAYPIENGKYFDLHFQKLTLNGTFWSNAYKEDTLASLFNYKWSDVCFPLTGLARVEAEPKPSMPAHFATLNCCAKCDKTHAELKTKYSELEAKYTEAVKSAKFMMDSRDSVVSQLAEATASAENLQDRLQDAQNCIAVQEQTITKLKNYIINQLLTN